MPQVPIVLPSDARTTVMPPQMCSATLNVVTLPLDVSEPEAVAYSPPLPFNPFCVVHWSNRTLRFPLKLQDVPAELQLESTDPFTVTVPLTAHDTWFDTLSVSALLFCSGSCCAG